MVTFSPSAVSFARVDIALNIFALLPGSETPDSDPADPAGWVARVRDGDEAAARMLFARLHPLVVKLVRAHLPWRSSPEDLVQMALIKVFTRLDQYAGQVPIEHWVSRITINTCLSQIQAERARPEWRWADLSREQTGRLEQLATADDGLAPSHALAARETVALLLVALPPADRLVVTLFYLEQRSIGEISGQTGWRGVTIRVRLMRARRKMEKILRGLGQEERP